MILVWYLIGVGGLVGGLAANLFTMYATRRAIARALGVTDVALFRRPRGARDDRRVSPGIRAAVFMGSAAATYLLAALLFVTSLLVGGRMTLPTRVTPLEGGAAHLAGLADGDRVVAVAGQRVDEWDALVAALRDHAGETVDLKVERDGDEMHVDVSPGARGTRDEGKIGIRAAGPTIRRAARGFDLLIAFTKPFEANLEALKRIFAAPPSELTGPVGIVRASAPETARVRFGDLVYFCAMLSCRLGVLAALLSLRRIPRKAVAVPRELAAPFD